MPFSATTELHDRSYWTRFFNSFIRRTVHELGYSCERSKSSARNLVRGIIGDLYQSDLVLAVLTDKNPNVYYELGARHALARGTVMILERGQTVPFDLASFGVIHYSDRDRKRFKEELARVTVELSSRSDPDGPVGEYLATNDTSLLRVSIDVERTPLSTARALDAARRDILFIGQNLHSLATNNDLRDLALSTLLRKAELRIRILIADYTFNHQVKALSQIIDEAMEEQYPEVVRSLHAWTREWSRLAPGDARRLDIRMCRRVGNVSATLVDGSSKDGMMLVRPVLYHTSGNRRPCIWLKAPDSPEVFHSYLASFEQIWSHGVKLK